MRPITPLLLTLSLALFVACGGPAPLPPEADALRPGGAPSRPNFVVFYVDDWGWRDAAFLGSGFYSTPRMDAFAQEGLLFGEAYAAGPNCAPSRASVMTGRYTPRHGILTVASSKRGKARNRLLVPIENRTQLADDELTIAELLRSNGYATAMIGKWHLGPDPRTQGFEFSVAGNQSGHPRSYFSPYGNRDLEDGPAGEYLTDRLTSEAVGFLERTGERPFFLYLSHYAVHTPIQALPGDTEEFTNKAPDGGQSSAQYAGMIAAVDRSFGRVLDTLERLGLSDNTLVILTSDNGGNGTVTSNAPLRGAKGMLFEGGIRVPLVMRWPGHVPSGTSSAEPVHAIDLFPTLAELAHASPASNVPIDGVSLVPLFEGRDLARDALFWHFPVYLEGDRTTVGPWRTTPVGAMRAGRWKLIEWFETGKLELFDLRLDPGESTDVSLERPDLTIALGKRIEAWRKSLGARVPEELEPAFVRQE